MRYKIYKDGEHVNTVVANEAFVTAYCEKHGYTFEEEIIEKPETSNEPETEPSVYDELDAAYREGVDSV